MDSSSLGEVERPSQTQKVTECILCMRSSMNRAGGGEEGGPVFVVTCKCSVASCRSCVEVEKAKSTREVAKREIQPHRRGR